MSKAATRPAGRPRRQFLRSAAGWAAVAAWWGGGGPPAAGAAHGVVDRAALLKKLAQLEAEDDRMFLVDRAETDLLYWLARLAQAREVLEIGTAHGYWTVWLALAAAERGGRVTTIEILPQRREKAMQHLQALGLNRPVNFLAGDAHEVVGTLRGVYDLIFLNADKAGNLDYFQKLYPRRLRAGGLLLAYNYRTRFDQMKDYVAAVWQHPGLDSAVVGAVAEDAFLASLDRRRR